MIHLAPFTEWNYINLETYRKNGQGVRTPVWFAERDGVFYFYTEAESFKVKRIRNNPRVRVAPCDVRGNIKGEWIEGQARILQGEESRLAHELITAKYGWQKKIGDFLARFRNRPRAEVAIHFV